MAASGRRSPYLLAAKREALCHFLWVCKWWGSEGQLHGTYGCDAGVVIIDSLRIIEWPYSGLGHCWPGLTGSGFLEFLAVSFIS